MPVSDQQQRRAALNPEHSYIVQAPAGSGKTGLLTLRILALLARADEPEEVLAITFTRKAAAEMKARLLRALELAGREQPEDVYQRQFWSLARAALARSEARGWALQQQTHRLRIMTIDGLCAALVRRMPQESGLGATMMVSEKSRPLLELAAERTLLLAYSAEYKPSLYPLLRHFEGKLVRLRRMLADMLQWRLNWGELLAHDLDAGVLEQNWTCWMSQRIAATAKAADRERAILEPLWQFSRAQCSTVSSIDAENWPRASLDDLATWRQFSDWLLTKNGSWRKTASTKQGFPAKASTVDPEQKKHFAQMKQCFVAFLGRMDESEDGTSEGLRQRLAELKLFPEPASVAQHADVTKALFIALRLALAQLWLVFSERNCLDFSELSLRAQQALSELDGPTELALRLDYQLNHILVDEFQDTSQSQKQLLHLLTAGWQPEDGRTLFLVGDPMQSIYRFRAAEVAIFMHAWDTAALGSVPLQTLRLKTNFRSTAGVVDWVNRTFAQVFPAENDAQTDAVCYVPSTAKRGATAADTITLQLFAPHDNEAEALWLVKSIESIRQCADDETIAVLVRSRAHLSCISSALAAAGIETSAVDIAPLTDQPLVQDLISLAAALIDPADRVHWLAVLRSPLCGLDLADITHLLANHDGSVLAALVRADDIDRLSTAGRGRIRTLNAVLQPAWVQRSQKPLAQWLEAVWVSLGGPGHAPDQRALEDVETFFELLADVPLVSENSLDDLQQRLSGLFAGAGTSAAKGVVLMTMHKAKGLEFDHIFLPALGRKRRYDERKLLEWTSWQGARAEPGLLLAPIPAADERSNPFGDLIRKLEKRKAGHEFGRLLYVAATRTRKRLWLSAAADPAEKIASGSALELLWPGLADEFECQQRTQNRAETATPDASTGVADSATPSVADSLRLTRLPLHCQVPAAKNFIARYQQPTVSSRPSGDDEEKHPPTPAQPTAVLAFSWAGERARMVGTVVHKILERLAHHGTLPGAPQRAILLRLADQELLAMGLIASQRVLARQEIAAILDTLAVSEQARWILRPHAQGEAELRLALRTDTGIERRVIDRTFVDPEGVRWIIDYKTGTHQGGDRSAYLRSEQQRYRPQLEHYAMAVAHWEQRPIKLGLYFPAMDELVTWDWQPVGTE